MIEDHAAARSARFRGFSRWSRRQILQRMTCLAAVSMIGRPGRVLGHFGAHGENLVALEAESLPDGPLEHWPNAGSLAGEWAAAEIGQRPHVATIDGRRAVVFDGDSALRSSFPLPDRLAGDKPFTVMLWVRMPRPQQVAGIFPLGPLPQFGAVFGRANVWHHVAWCYDGGENGALRFFLDGELAGEKPVTMATAAGGPLLIGGALDNETRRPDHPFVGAIASLHVLDYPLEPREVRNVLGKFTAFGPTPNHLATVKEGDVVLHWTVGRNGARSRLFLASTEEALAAAEPEPSSQIRIDREAGQCEYGPIAVAPGEQVFWRIDHFFRGRTDRGDVWIFTRSAQPTGQ